MNILVQIYITGHTNALESHWQNIQYVGLLSIGTHLCPEVAALLDVVLFGTSTLSGKLFNIFENYMEESIQPSLVDKC